MPIVRKYWATSMVYFTFSWNYVISTTVNSNPTISDASSSIDFMKLISSPNITIVINSYSLKSSINLFPFVSINPNAVVICRCPNCSINSHGYISPFSLSCSWNGEERICWWLFCQTTSVHKVWIVRVFWEVKILVICNLSHNFRQINLWSAIIRVNSSIFIYHNEHFAVITINSINILDSSNLGYLIVVFIE